MAKVVIERPVLKPRKGRRRRFVIGAGGASRSFGRPKIERITVKALKHHADKVLIGHEAGL